MLPTHPEVLNLLAEGRLESVRGQVASARERSGLRRRAGGWLVAAGLKLAPELRQKVTAAG